MEKISLLFAGAGTLGVKEVEECLSGEGTYSPFEWLDAVQRGDRDKALAQLAGLLNRGEAPLSLLGLLLYRLRRTARSAAPSPSGRPWDRAAAPAFNQADLPWVFTCCLKADSRLKQSQLSPQLIMEELTFELCRSEKTPPSGWDPSRALGRAGSGAGLLF